MAKKKLKVTLVRSFFGTGKVHMACAQCKPALHGACGQADHRAGLVQPRTGVAGLVDQPQQGLTLLCGSSA